MKEEDKKRIEKAAKEYTSLLTHAKNLTEEACVMDFTAGAKYNHPIAYNQAIEDVISIVYKVSTPKNVRESLFQEIQKLKKP